MSSGELILVNSHFMNVAYSKTQICSPFLLHLCSPITLFRWFYLAEGRVMVVPDYKPLVCVVRTRFGGPLSSYVPREDLFISSFNENAINKCVLDVIITLQVTQAIERTES